jgi:hypothetical protein
MFDNIIAILGLAALCSAWALFQIWVDKDHTDKATCKAGCCGCGNDK